MKEQVLKGTHRTEKGKVITVPLVQDHRKTVKAKIQEGCQASTSKNMVDPRCPYCKSSNIEVYTPGDPSLKWRIYTCLDCGEEKCW